jgi:hypothetical protein
MAGLVLLTFVFGDCLYLVVEFIRVAMEEKFPHILDMEKLHVFKQVLINMRVAMAPLPFLFTAKNNKLVLTV